MNPEHSLTVRVGDQVVKGPCNEMDATAVARIRKALSRFVGPGVAVEVIHLTEFRAG